MLVKTGAIIVIKAKHKNSGFKRSRTLEGKLKDPEKGQIPSFQPFQLSVSADDDTQEVWDFNIAGPECNIAEPLAGGSPEKRSDRWPVAYNIWKPWSVEFLVAGVERTFRLLACGLQHLEAATPVLPPTITDQVRLWELERDRLQFTEGVLYNQFLSQVDFELLRDYARDLGVLVWENPPKPLMVVTPTGHPDVKRFWIRQKHN